MQKVIVTLRLCVAQEFYLDESGASFHFAIFALSWTPQVVLQHRDRERGEKERRGWCGREERKENAKQEWKEGRRRKRDRGMGGLSSLYCCAMFCVTLKSEFYFMKHTRGALYSIWYAWPQLDPSILSSAELHTKTHGGSWTQTVWFWKRRALS